MAAVQAKFEPHDTPNEDVSEQSLLETAMSSGLLSNANSGLLSNPDHNGVMNNSQSYLNNDSSMGDDQDMEKGNDTETYLREQDRFLPIANVSRIMKRAVPPIGKIAKDAKECVQECVSEFISFITSEASERCQQEKRKTINGEDILFAMSTLGFDSYVEPLKIYLQKYREWVKQGEKGISNVKGEGEDDQRRSLHDAQVHYVGSLPQTMLSENQTHQLYASHFQSNLSQFS